MPVLRRASSGLNEGSSTLGVFVGDSDTVRGVVQALHLGVDTGVL
jgi:hypothetical protein